ncbi:MAG: hypothetical protein J0665_01220 [Deltaproteobacteria bacterium]|nr:hypothetical protein [Deltaproteobacteria bacterium]
MGVKNKLSDLNDHLFAQLERLSDEETTGDELKEEIERSKSVTMIARTIIDNGKLVLDAAKAINDRSIVNAPKMLGISNEV